MHSKFLHIIVAVPLMIGHQFAAANEFADILRNLAQTEIKEIISNQTLIDAIRAQNIETSGISAANVKTLDERWKAEIGSSDAALIGKVLRHPASELLRRHRDDSRGIYTEIFVMDAIGLNVAASNTTSDYWQGDEAKWQKTFMAGSEALHIGDVEFDDSTQTYQSQISITVTDPDTKKPIGAATFGVNVELLH